MSNDLNRTKELINVISPSFCAAKWYNASIWLSNGRTASCHHPLAHFVPTAELLKNPSALHNTSAKKVFRKEMLEGVRPKECGYCWKVEDLNNPEIHSDRIYKSAIYNFGDILSLQELDPNSDIDPKTLEICFDNLCNLACSYCNSEFSSTWGNDIITNGPYTAMKTDGGHTYENDGQHGMPFGPKNTGNIYIKKFFEWYNGGLKDNLQELRVSGGEPSRSPDFWKLVDSFNHEKFAFAVNSNLIMEQDRLQKLIDIKQHFKKYDVYTSCESYGKHAEFVRSGLNYEDWKKNLFTLQTSAPEINTHIMLTVSALSVWSLDLFLDDIIALRKETQQILGGTKTPYFMSVNILRFPSFQSVNIIPSQFKEKLASSIELIVNNNQQYLTSTETNNFQRCIAYLREVESSYEDVDDIDNKINDFKEFISQYSERRGLPFVEYMPSNFFDWFKTIW